MKIVLTESLSASPNPFVMPDGMANLNKIATLGERAAKHITKDAGSAQVMGAYYLPRKAKPVNHSQTKNDKGDLKYLAQRATKVVFRKRMTDNPALKLLLPVLTKEAGAPEALMAQIKQASTALNQHVRKSETVKTKVSKEKAKIREASDKAFQTSLKAFKEILVAGGVKDTDIVEAQGMFGRTVMVKFGAGEVVTIGKADLAKFRAAKKEAAAQAA